MTNVQDTRKQLIGEDVVTLQLYIVRKDVSALKCRFYILQCLLLLQRLF